MSDGSIWVLIPLTAIIAGTMIKLKYGPRDIRRDRTGAVQDETVERLGSLTAQNAALMNKIKDLELRIQTLERIATDPSTRLAAEIDRLG
jgi:hypothetical protein